MFVGPIIIQYQMEFQLFGKLVIQAPQKFQELLVTMPRKALANDFALQDLQGREERRRPVPDIIMSECAAAALLERQTRLSAVQGLDLALFVDTQDQTLLGRIEVEPNHVRQLFQKLEIPGKFETPRLMGLKIVVLPQAVDGAPANLLSSRHCATTPMSQTFWLGLQRRLNHGCHLDLIIGWL